MDAELGNQYECKVSNVARGGNTHWSCHQFTHMFTLGGKFRAFINLVYLAKTHINWGEHWNCSWKSPELESNPECKSRQRHQPLHQITQTWGVTSNEANPSDVFSNSWCARSLGQNANFCAWYQKILQVFHNIAVTCRTLQLKHAVWQRCKSDW